MQIPVLPQHAVFNFLVTRALADQAIVKAMDSSKDQVTNQSKESK